MLSKKEKEQKGIEDMNAILAEMGILNKITLLIDRNAASRAWRIITKKAEEKEEEAITKSIITINQSIKLINITKPIKTIKIIERGSQVRRCLKSWGKQARKPLIK